MIVYLTGQNPYSMIRKYQPADIEAVLDAWYRASLLAHPFLDEAFLERERCNIREVYMPNTDTWVFEQEDGVVGFIAMLGNEVGALFLLPEYHGQGIGRQLMDHAANLYGHLEVEVFKRNTIGRGFYSRYGFEAAGERRHEETGHALVRMKYEQTSREPE